MMPKKFIHIILLAAVAAGVYANSFRGVFLLDDQIRVVENEHIRELWPPWPSTGFGRRPVLYLSFSVNYALSKLDPSSYHVLNLLIHIASAVVLYIIIRETCRLPSVAQGLSKEADTIAFLTSLIWMVHPLQTQSVTYITQRAESLAGLFYLSTVLCAIRYMTGKNLAWVVSAFIMFLLGALTKEVIVTAPVIILLFDKTYVSLSFKQAWRKHKNMYLALGAVWGCILVLMLTVKPLELTPTAGFGYKAITPVQYAMTQPQVILHYLRLIVWPRPLVFDYSWPPGASVTGSLPALVFLTALIILAAKVFLRKTAVRTFGFLGLCGFIVLLPSSSIIPLKDLAFEHRTYLCSAFIILGIVLFVRHLLKKVLSLEASSAELRESDRLFFRGSDRAVHFAKLRRSVSIMMSVVTILALSGLTIQRNRDYHSGLRMWRDTVAKRPRNARANNNYAWFLLKEGQKEQSVVYFQKALKLDPDPRGFTSFGTYYLDNGEEEKAISHFQKALELNEQYTDAHLNLGGIFVKRKQYEKAIQHYKTVVALEPDYAVAYNNLGGAYLDQGSFAQAVEPLRQAIHLGFREPGVYHNLGMAYAMTGRPYEAITQLQKALDLDPGYRQAKLHLEEIKQNLNSRGVIGE